MLITKIESQVNNNQRVSIYLDDEYAFGMEAIDWVNLKLTLGPITEERLYEVKKTVLATRLKERAFGYVSRRLYTQKEIERKLRDSVYQDLRGGSDPALYGDSSLVETIIQNTSELLLSYGYIDDEKFTLQYLESRGSRYGLNKIKAELKQRGVSDEIINECVQTQPPDEDAELEKVLALLEKKLGRLDRAGKALSDPKERRRITEFLLRRGYSYSLIGLAFKRINQSDV